ASVRFVPVKCSTIRRASKAASFTPPSSNLCREWRWSAESIAGRAAATTAIFTSIACWHPPLACRPSPPQGGRSTTLPSPLHLKRRFDEASPRLISPLEGEMAGRPEGGEDEYNP